MRVAVISQTSSISEALLLMLRRSGHDAVAAPDAATLLQVLGGQPPDAVVFHLGSTAVASLATWLATMPGVPVFVMVDRMEPTTASTARSLHAHSILTRPISEKQLCLLIQEVDPSHS